MTTRRAVDVYRAANIEAARIIAADPKYTGIMREWAARILKRAEPAVTGPLFAERRAA